jgi:hypothetical protein
MTEQVGVKIITDQLVTPLLLEVRLYISSDFDCQLLLEAGTMKGLIDVEVELLNLPRYTVFQATVHLGNLQRMAIRVKNFGGLFDVVSFTAVDHASRLIQNPPRAWPGKAFDVSIQKAHVHRDNPGKKRSRFLV